MAFGGAVDPVVEPQPLGRMWAVVPVNELHLARTGDRLGGSAAENTCTVGNVIETSAPRTKCRIAVLDLRLFYKGGGLTT